MKNFNQDSVKAEIRTLKFPNKSPKLTVWTGIFGDVRLRITEFRRQIV